MPHRLVLLGDSLTAFTPDGRFRPGSPAMFPHLLAQELATRTAEAWEVDVVAQTWWSVQAASREAVRSQELRARLAGANAVVVAIATADMLPVVPGTRWILRGPTTVAEHRPVLRGIRPRWLKPRLWALFSWMHYRVVALTRARFSHTRREDLGPAWSALVGEIRLLAPDAEVCAVLPSNGREGTFVWPSRHLQWAADTIRAEAAAAAVPIVDLAAVVEPWIAELPDGTHWHEPVHIAVSEALASALASLSSTHTSDSALELDVSDGHG